MKKRRPKSNERGIKQPVPSGSMPSNTYFRSSQSYSSVSSTQRNSRQSGKSSAGERLFSPLKALTSLLKSFSKITSLIIGASILLIIFYGTTLSSNDSSVTIKNDSFHFRVNSEYENFTNEYVKNNILAKSKIFFPLGDFNEAFKNEFPEVTTIDTKIPFADRSIQIAIDTPDPLFKISSIQVAGSETSYVDANGTAIIVGNVNKDQNNDSTPVLTVDSSSLIENGSRIMTQNEVTIITLLKNEIKPDEISGLPANFAISSADLDIANGRVEVGFIGVDYIVRFSGYSDARNQVGALKAILTELYASSGKGRTLPEEYIDVRVFEKVFIK